MLLVGGAVLLEPLRAPTEGVIAPRSLFLFGILLLTADTFGALAHDLRVPRLLGYLVAGLALGPSVAGIVPAGVLEDLGMMKRLAIGLIAVLAGAELRIGDLRQRGRIIAFILLFQTVFVLAVVVAATSLGSRWIPFLDGLTSSTALIVTLVFALMLTVNSPMVTLALLTETGARGPLAKTTLGVVLVADVAVIVLFTASFSLAQASLGAGGAGAAQVMGQLLGEVLKSIVAGFVIGGIMSLYVHFVKRELVVFAVLVVFATAGAAEALHFELLLSLVIAGFLVENVAPVQAEHLVDTLHQTAIPVFVVFFAMTGAELRIQEFAAFWPAVLGLVLLRMGALYASGRLGGRWGGAESPVTQYVWTGLVPQAGVALGLAAMVADRLPVIGLPMQTLTVGIIAVNQAIGPILFRRGLERAGEVTLR
jgi:Kef-type K+ transport system membrane component KefB